MQTKDRLVKKFCAFLVVVLAICLPLATFAEEPAGLEQVTDADPSQTVGALQEKLLEAMKRAEELGYQGRYDLLEPALASTFDLDFMASKAVGRGWKSLDGSQQVQWKDAFGRLITATFAGRFEGYSGQQFEIVGEQPAAHDTIMVLTKIVDPGKDDIALNYRMHDVDTEWKIVDVYFNGTVSELAMRRSEYSSVLKRDGFESLLAAVDARIADYASGKTEE